MAICCAWLLLLASGCGGQPQIGAANYKLLDALRTSTAAKRADWLEKNARVVAERHSDGSLDDEQYRALQAIVDEAREGNWAEAEAHAIALSKAQRQGK